MERISFRNWLEPINKMERLRILTGIPGNFVTLTELDMRPGIIPE